MPPGTYERTEAHREAARQRRGRTNRALMGEDHPGWVGDDACESTVHQRLVRRRGKASSYPCADCGKQARDWSHIEPVGYSTDPYDYEPRCRSCHRAYDYSLLVAAYAAHKKCASS